MNRLTQTNRTAPTTATSSSSTKASSSRFRIAGPAWQQLRERDFGVGYGNSSGYASDRSYAENWGQERFRMA